MKKLLRLFRALLVLLALAPCAFAQNDKVYGVIEIGAKGIKPVVVEFPTETPGAEEPAMRLLKKYETLNINGYDSGAAGRVAVEVARIREEMFNEFQLPTDHTFLVGSSGLPEEARKAIGDHAIEGLPLEYIDAATEARLEFQGVVPPNRLNPKEVVLVDIGSGNSKGCYLEKTRPDLQFTTFDVALGTETFGAALAKAATGGAESVEAAKKDLRKSVTELVAVHPATRTAPRLYLAGGIVWWAATLMHPEAVGRNEKGAESFWIELSKEEIQRFCTTAMTDPSRLPDADFSRVRPENLNAARKEVEKAQNTFTTDRKMAGAFILKAFVDEMQANKAKIVFARGALYAWPMGYVMAKARP